MALDPRSVIYVDATNPVRGSSWEPRRHAHQKGRADSADNLKTQQQRQPRPESWGSRFDSLGHHPRRHVEHLNRRWDVLLRCARPRLCAARPGRVRCARPGVRQPLGDSWLGAARSRLVGALPGRRHGPQRKHPARRARRGAVRLELYALCAASSSTRRASSSQALTNGGWSKFGTRTARYLMRMFDGDRSGVLGYQEFEQLMDQAS